MKHLTVIAILLMLFSCKRHKPDEKYEEDFPVKSYLVGDTGKTFVGYETYRVVFTWNSPKFTYLPTDTITTVLKNAKASFKPGGEFILSPTIAAALNIVTTGMMYPALKDTVSGFRINDDTSSLPPVAVKRLTRSSGAPLDVMQLSSVFISPDNSHWYYNRVRFVAEE